MPIPDAALIEIIERTDSPDPKVIVPNEVRINGVPILAPDDEPIEIHGTTILAGADAVKVTLTLYARRIVVAHEAKGGQ